MVLIDSLSQLFKRKKKEPNKLLRNQTRMQGRYPGYQFGVGTYGRPCISDWKEGSTLEIGNYCSIAEGVHFYLGGHHRTDWLSSFPFPAFIEEAKGVPDFGGTHGDIIVGSDVWLCSQAIILSGVKIGHGAVVAAGSVVTKDVPPYTVVGGNPARVIKKRFNDETCEFLLASRWWEWPESEVRSIAKLLCSSDLEPFKAYCQARIANGSAGS
ncbi:acetyltransferase-like isoleucine patch superfamily enzyme [Pseudomonas duriflava]|uniref:Acetyltransferase-like isoleucine patch superfamily enzyme n=1 Tax=Pseudomonas duriflava TaxID=459528 RepID=A0A562QKV8_9PSED|nr:CatB-related O-acetyltransferase [Pseudomonas duriflava]TWI57397.1 acetyltransferase-like isoleucine patch superfamily enzyme [Pseudomonas duriflava]